MLVLNAQQKTLIFLTGYLHIGISCVKIIVFAFIEILFFLFNIMGTLALPTWKMFGRGVQGVGIWGLDIYGFGLKYGLFGIRCLRFSCEGGNCVGFTNLDV